MSGSFTVTSDESVVEVTSLNRLPFEPKTDALKSLRGAIQSAVRGVSSRPGFILSGTYSSSDRSLCDTENILFYNVGLSSFAGLSSEGIRFERSFQVPEGTANAHQHHARYQLIHPDAPFSAWRAGPTLVAWQRVPLPPIGEGTKPAPIWYALSDARIVQTSKGAAPSAYGLRLSLALPAVSRV